MCRDISDSVVLNLYFFHCGSQLGGKHLGVHTGMGYVMLKVLALVFLLVDCHATRTFVAIEGVMSLRVIGDHSGL